MPNDNGAVGGFNGTGVGAAGGIPGKNGFGGLTGDRWEFPRHRLKFFNILGEGAFGQVWRCEATDIDGKFSFCFGFFFFEFTSSSVEGLINKICLLRVSFRAIEDRFDAVIIIYLFCVYTSYVILCFYRRILIDIGIIMRQQYVRGWLPVVNI